MAQELEAVPDQHLQAAVVQPSAAVQRHLSRTRLARMSPVLPWRAAAGAAATIGALKIPCRPSAPVQPAVAQGLA
jgi:hypothetical protein